MVKINLEVLEHWLRTRDEPVHEDEGRSEGAQGKVSVQVVQNGT